MRLIKTGKYEAPIELEWNECLFVDRWCIGYSDGVDNIRYIQG